MSLPFSRGAGHDARPATLIGGSVRYMTKRNTGDIEQRVFAFIREFRLEHGYAPTFREIAAGLGYKGIGNIHRAVKALAERGLILWRRKAKRAIDIFPQWPVITVELPAELYANVQDVARKAKVTPEAVVIEAVRDGFRHLRTCNVHFRDKRETFSGGDPEHSGAGTLDPRRETAALERPHAVDNGG